MNNYEDFGNWKDNILDAIFFFLLITQAADELREQEAQQKNDEIQQKSAQLEQTQVLNSVLIQVGIPLPIQQDHNNYALLWFTLR